MQKKHLSVGFPKNMYEKIALLDMKNETLYSRLWKEEENPWGEF